MSNKPLTTEETDALKERAAIMEFDAGLPRDQAEAEALKDILGRRLLSQ